MPETRIRITADDLAAETCKKVGQAVKEMGLVGTDAGDAMHSALSKIQNDAKALSTEMRALGSAATAVGAGLTAAVTVPIVGMGAAALKASIDFESAFSGVKKTVSGTPAELQAINQQFRDMATVTPVSASGLAKIGEMAGQLGVHKEQITGFTKTIVDIRTATNLTADEAGSSFARLANVMKMPQEQFSNLGSAVVALGNFGASTEQEMLSMGQRIAAAGSTAGMSAPQVLGIANALSSVGIEAESGGTAMSRVINKISMDVASGGGKLDTFAKIAGESAQQFKKSWKDDAGNAFSDFMQGLAKARERGGDELLGLIHELGFDTNVRLVNAFMSAANAGDLMKDSIALGSKAFKENTELTRAAGERYQTTANQLKTFQNNITDIAITLGDAMLPALNGAAVGMKPFVEHVRDAVREFANLPESARVATFAIAGVAAAAGPLLLTVGGVAFSIAQVSTALVAVPALGTAAAAAFGVMTTGMTGMVVASVGVTGAIAAVGGLSYALTLGVLDWTRWSDAVERASLRMQRWLGLIGPATDADIANAVAAGRSAREHDGLAASTNSAADAAKRLTDAKDRLSGALATKDLSVLTQVAREFSEAGTLSTSVMKRLATEAEQLQQAGGKLSPELAAIVSATHQMRDASSGAASTTNTLADKVKALTAEQRADILSKYDQKESLKAIAGETGIAIDLVSTFIKQQHASTAEGKSAAAALREYAEAGLNVRETVDKMSGAVVEGIKTDLARDISQKAIQVTYGVTAQQIKAIITDEKNWQKSLAETDKAISEFRKTGEEGASAVTKSFAGMSILKDLSIQMGDVQIAAKDLSWKGLAVVTDQSDRAKQHMFDLTYQVGALERSLEAMPEVIVQAFSSGGGIGGAIGGAASLLGKNIGEDMASSIQTSLQESSGEALSGLTKGMLKAIPVVGSLIGPAITALFKMFGPSQAELEGRKVEDAFEKSFGGFQGMMTAVGAAYAATGRSAQQAQVDIAALLAAEKQGGDAAAAAANKIKQAFTEQTQDAADLTAAVQKYGFTLAELGPTMQKQQLDEQARALLNDWRLLVGSGMDVVTVDQRMASSIQDYLKAAKTTGQEVPIAMQPILQKMIDQGLLTDENGNKITDMKDLGVTFAMTMSEGLQKVVDKLDQLLTKIGLIPAAAAAAAAAVPSNPFGDWQIPESPDNGGGAQYASRGGYIGSNRVEYMAVGGFPGSPRGADNVPVWMARDEAVLNRNATATLGRDAVAALNRGLIPAAGGGGSTRAFEARIDALHATLKRQGEQMASLITALPVSIQSAMLATGGRR